MCIRDSRIIKIGDVDNEGGEFLLELSDSNAKFIAGGSNSVLINSTGLGIGGYVVGRSAEKIAKSVIITKK